MYPIDNLTLAVETAKRVLTKEKIDRQMSGQSSTAPFMKVSDGQKSCFKNSNKKEVSFGAIETIERNSGSMDKLTSLVREMNMKMDKYDAQYKPQVYHVEGEDRINVNYRQNNYQPINRLYSSDRINIEVEETFDRNYRSNIRGRS